MHRWLSTLLPWLLFASAPAQSVWIVDAAGGSGSHFTAIQPAIDAAADGDRILVRAGAYAGFVVDGKALAILGEPGVRVTTNALVRVLGLAVAQQVVLTDVAIVGARPPIALELSGARQCTGRVLFERVAIAAAQGALRFDDCADVRLSECALQVGTSFVSSRATLTDTHAAVATLVTTPPPALSLVAADVLCSRCQVAGQSAVLNAGASVAVAIDAMSRLTLTDDGMQAIAAGAGSLGPLAAVVGAGRVDRDPRVVLLGSNGAPPLAVGTDIVTDIPTLRVRGVPIGATLDVDLAGRQGAVFGLVLGLPGPPVQLPGIAGTLVLGTPLIAVAGVFAATPLHLSLVVQPGIAPGTEIAWQAIAADGHGGFRLSNGATYARTR